MIIYSYKHLPADAVYDLCRVSLEPQPDSFIAQDQESEKYNDLIGAGYRWIRTEDGKAVFEKEIEEAGALDLAEEIISNLMAEEECRHKDAQRDGRIYDVTVLNQCRVFLKLPRIE